MYENDDSRELSLLASYHDTDYNEKDLFIEIKNCLKLTPFSFLPNETI